MRETHQTEQLTDTVSLGMLAENMVFVSGRLLRDESLDERDRDTLDAAGRLLAGVGEVSKPEASASLIRRVAAEEGHLTLRALRSRMPDRDEEVSEDEVRILVDRLVELLSRARSDTLQPEDRDDLHAMRMLFASLGDYTLKRTQDLMSSRRRSSARWISSRATSAS
jgi:hypothetical protein